GRRRLGWCPPRRRLTPADSRVRMLAEATPAHLVAFDLLAVGDDDLTGRPFAERRAALERARGETAPAGSARPPGGGPRSRPRSGRRGRRSTSRRPRPTWRSRGSGSTS